MQISSNEVLSIVFLLYVDVFQPKWSLPVDICSHVVISCIFSLSLPGGRTLRTLPSLLVRAGEWTFSNSTGCFKWTFAARWSFIIYFFSPEGGLSGHYHLG